MKNRVLHENKHTAIERLHANLNQGVSSNLSEDDLSWLDQRLFLEDAPEPHDVNWTAIYRSTREKVLARILSWTLFLILEAAFFCIIYLLCVQIHDLAGDSKNKNAVLTLNYCVTLSIICFNQFAVARILHFLVSFEQWSTKTRLYTSLAWKLSLAQTMNLCMLFAIQMTLPEKYMLEFGGSHFLFPISEGSSTTRACSSFGTPS